MEKWPGNYKCIFTKYAECSNQYIAIDNKIKEVAKLLMNVRRGTNRLNTRTGSSSEIHLNENTLMYCCDEYSREEMLPGADYIPRKNNVESDEAPVTNTMFTKMDKVKKLSDLKLENSSGITSKIESRRSTMTQNLKSLPDSKREMNSETAKAIKNRPKVSSIKNKKATNSKKLADPQYGDVRSESQTNSKSKKNNKKTQCNINSNACKFSVLNIDFHK